MRITNPDDGISFAFDFHHVRRIVVGESEQCQNFATRRVYLIDAAGREVEIICFSESGCAFIPARLDMNEEDAA